MFGVSGRMRSNLAKFRLLRSLWTTCGPCARLLVVLLRNGTVSPPPTEPGDHINYQSEQANTSDFIS